MKNWVSSLLSGLAGSKSARARLRQASRLDSQRRRTLLRLEFLEDRRQLAPGDASLVGLNLLAEGTPGDDVIIISQTTDGLYLARVNDEMYGPFDVPGNLQVLGDAGNDVIVIVNTSLQAILDGGADNDFIFGSFGNDTIVGGLGSDLINAADGNNTVWGDQQNQQAAATGSGDIISTLGGDDVVYGGGGDDQLNLGSGNDYAFGGTGNDLIGGEAGNDRIYGGTGNDVVSGDAGDDLLVGNDGNDELYGRIGRDVVIGGSGADLLNGQEDVDLVLGRGTTNETSTTVGDASDVALAAALTTWVATTPAALLTPVLAATDGGGDTIFGYTGGDRFYADQLDNLADFNLPFMGTDTLEVFAGSAALPAGSPVPPGTAALVANDLVIQGTALADRIIVSPLGVLYFDVSVNGVHFGPFNVPAPGITIINAGDGDDVVEVRETLIAVTVNGEGGNDYISTSGGDDIITGGLGDDQINASSGNNTVWGDSLNEQALPAGGNDKISTLGGADVVYGGGGNDEMNLGAGDDHGYGGAGNDTIGGEDGTDELYGGAGNDVMSGDTGNDLLVGQDGNDTLIGRTGLDVVIGGAGIDIVNGGEDNDVVIGRGLTTENSTTAGDANDITNFNLFSAWVNTQTLGLFIPVLAANDNAIDTLYGFTGNDDFYADQLDVRADFNLPLMGTDTLEVFAGSAALPAGSPVAPGTAALVGNDLVVNGTNISDRITITPANGDRVLNVTVNGVQWGAFLIPAIGNIVVTAGDGEDIVDIIHTTANAIVDGGNGDDYIATSFGNDVIQGGLGEDQINASEGNNTVWGDVQDQQAVNAGSNDKISTMGGADVVYGGGGNDEIALGAGADYAFGGFGNDTIGGEDGNDRLYGGDGNDVMSGDAGDDLLLGNAGNDRLMGRTGRDIVVGGTGADEVSGQEDQDALVGRSLTNEASTTVGDANDVALNALLAQWAATQPLGLLTPFLGANDTLRDVLTGGTGIDDFYADVNDRLADYRLAGQGQDRRVL
jgi:Ca2+-binding RTX toxin-like protein